MRRGPYPAEVLRLTARVSASGGVRSGVSEPCWEWPGPFHTKLWRYGILNGPGGRRVATRAVLEAHTGKAVEGFALHCRDNPPCVRPDHLRDGTPMDNVRDRDVRQRFVPLFGLSNGRGRFSAADVEELARRVSSGETKAAVGRAFTTSGQAVGYCLKRRLRV